jgi:hypothetical protein
MKKKGHSTIPDFSRARVASPQPQPRTQKGAARPPAPGRSTIKPQATSAKSGRRGQ